MRLPDARPADEQDPPRIIVASIDGGDWLDKANDLPLDGLRPARTFRSGPGQRHAPQRPYVEVAGMHIKVESQTEAAIAHLLSRRPDVVNIWPQPFWIERVVDGRPSWGCPDFLMRHADGRLIVVEVKAAHQPLSPRTLVSLDAMRASCHRHGLGFELATGLGHRDQQVLDLLFAYRSPRVGALGPGADVVRTEIRRAAEAPIALSDLWHLGPAWQTKPLVWWMLWHNELCFDWGEPVHEGTQVIDHARHSDSDPAATLTHWRCGPTRSPTLDDLKERRA